ncbi:MAG: 50S ribosomal protein L3 [Clostridia bacterium]|nr:50S ribosomal protein L3 [Clostridia bacterium]MBR6754791.1 50S ribosomal protein L3 [Clostridia bacterium]
MKKGIIGRKLGMTQLFDEKGKVVPVTVISAGPCVVVQKRTNEKNGYEAVQLGFSDIPERKLNKPQKGVFTKAEVSFKKYLKEFRLDDSASMNVGDVITADTFEVGEKVDITGVTKGHGFSGAIKRWGLHRLRMTHGTGPVHRQSGSMGVIDPAHIFKNKKMAGQYGNEQVTMLNLEIIKIDPDNNLIAVKGAVPGAKGGIVYLRSTVK